MDRQTHTHTHTHTHTEKRGKGGRGYHTERLKDTNTKIDTHTSMHAHTHAFSLCSGEKLSLHDQKSRRHFLYSLKRETDSI